MTFNEFKYWLEGYTAHIAGAPNEEQWSVIKEKLNQVSFTNFTVNPALNPPNTVRTYPSLPYNPIYYSVGSTTDTKLTGSANLLVE